MKALPLYKHTLLVLLLSSFLCSCKTIKERDFSIDKPISKIVPPLRGSIDIANLKKLISYGSLRVSGYYDGYYKINKDFDTISVLVIDPTIRNSELRTNPERYETRVTFSEDKRVSDIIKLFSKEVYGDSTASGNSTFGDIEFELISFKEKKNPLLAFFSIWTLCIPSLVGVPVNYIKTSLEIEVKITDKEKARAFKYKAKAKGIAFIAMYWGYGDDAVRKSNLSAYKNAMKSIKTQIQNDSVLLAELHKKRE